MLYEMPPYRPPSEAYSLLIRATRSCPWNKCVFCRMYEVGDFELRPVEDVMLDIRKARSIQQAVIEKANREGWPLYDLANRCGLPWIGEPELTAFVGDSNSIIMKTPNLVEVIRCLYETFPELTRVTSYGRARTVVRKSIEEMVALREAGLTRLHVGLESGDDFLLDWMRKGATAEDMVQGGIKVKQAGISLSEYVILGIGGQKWWRQHALNTAKVLNAIEPDFIRLRTLMVRPGSELDRRVAAGEFQLSDPVTVLEEQRLLIENLEAHSELVSDHVSNYIPISGTLPDDRSTMLRQIDDVLSALREDPAAARGLLQPEELRHL